MTPLEYFKANRERMLEELKDLLRIPSVSAQPEHKADVEKCAQWLVDHCKSIGLTAELRKTAGNPIVIARTPNFDKAAKETYNVYGHYDVQPAEPLNEWTKTKDPFEPVIADGNIYGRGSMVNSRSVRLLLVASKVTATGWMLMPLPTGPTL